MLGKSKLNTIDILISTPFIDSVTSNYDFDLINNLQIEYDKMKKEIKNLKTLIIVYQDFSLVIKLCYQIVWSVEKMQKLKIQNIARTKNGRVMLLSKCKVCDNEKKNEIYQKARSLLII